MPPPDGRLAIKTQLVSSSHHRYGLGTHKEQRCTAGDDFDVAFMRGKERDQAVGQAAFATHPENDWRGHRYASLYCMDKQALGAPPLCTRQRLRLDLQEESAGSAGRAGCWRIHPARLFSFGDFADIGLAGFNSISHLSPLAVMPIIR